jgi:hypothetical protein
MIAVMFMALIALAGPLFVVALAILCAYVAYLMFVDLVMYKTSLWTEENNGNDTDKR